jgi:hypothetical protein
MQMEAGLTLVKSAKEEILQRVDAHDFWAGLPAAPEELKVAIRRRLARAFEEPLNPEHAERTEMLHQLSAPFHRKLLSWMDQATNDIPKITRHLAGELESLYRELYKVEEALRKSPADETLRPLLEQLHDLHHEFAEVGKQALVMDEEIRREEFKLSELRRQHHQMTEKLATQATNPSRVHLISRIQKVLEEYQSTLLDKKVRQLEGAVTECFSVLSRKKDAVHRMSINPKDFSVTLYDGKTNYFRKHNSQLERSRSMRFRCCGRWGRSQAGRCRSSSIHHWRDWTGSTANFSCGITFRWQAIKSCCFLLTPRSISPLSLSCDVVSRASIDWSLILQNVKQRSPQAISRRTLMKLTKNPTYHRGIQSVALCRRKDWTDA